MMKEFQVNKLSSLSGLAEYNNLLFTVSDEFYSVTVTDLQQQYQYDFNEEQNRQLIAMDFQERKKWKPDFESLSVVTANGKTYLHLMPSFSKPQRAVGFLLELDGQNRGCQKSFFASAQAIDYKCLLDAGLKFNLDMNIEGHVFRDTQLWLFNRGNLTSPSQLIECVYDWKNFKPKINRIFDVDLGEFDGLKLQWTDALLKSSEEIIFSATVEKSENSYDDGEVLASFVGEFNLSTLKVRNVKKMIDKVKIEGIALIQEDLAFCIDPDIQGNYGKIFFGIKL